MIRVNADISNPGQYFACCGLLELADRLWPGAEGGFTGHNFDIDCSGSSEAMLAALIRCSIASSLGDGQISELKKLGNSKKATRTDAEWRRMAELEELRSREQLHFGETFQLAVDWWGDPSWKTWAGKQFVLDIARGMHAAVRRSHPETTPPSEWFRISTDDDALPFNFDSDLSAGGAALDAGFSMDALKMRTRTKPMIELAAFVGLQRFRPRKVDNDLYEYFAWSQKLVPELASVAHVLPVSGRRYQFPVHWRNDYYKSFSQGAAIGGAT